MASMILTPLKSARSDLEKIELEVGRRCIISSSARKVAQLPIKKIPATARGRDRERLAPDLQHPQFAERSQPADSNKKTSAITAIAWL